MERKIIKQWQNQKKILMYVRYVADICVVVKKGLHQQLLKEMNNFDEGYLEFTISKMSDNKLEFLDTQIYLDEVGIFQFRKFRKPTASDVLVDFKCGVTPRKYKLSTLKEEIHRCHHTNTTKYELEIALQNLKKQFLINNYPKSLIESHIDEIKGRDFAPSFDRVAHET